MLILSLKYNGCIRIIIYTECVRKALTIVDNAMAQSSSKYARVASPLPVFNM